MWPRNSRPPQLPTIFDRYDWLEETRQNTAKVLQFVDEVGSWNIASSLTVLGIFVLESYTQVELTEVCARVPLPIFDMHFYSIHDAR